MALNVMEEESVAGWVLLDSGDDSHTGHAPPFHGA